MGLPVAMFWEYSGDKKGYLLKVIADSFKI
jgi:hypothetical protein